MSALSWFFAALAAVVFVIVYVPSGTYARAIAVALDMFVAVFVFWKRSGITVSSHAALARQEGKRWGCVLCKALEFFDPGHCAAAVREDIKRAQAAIQTLLAGVK